MRHTVLLLIVGFSFVGLLAYRVWSYATAVTTRYEHSPGLHDANLVSLGGDRYHADVVFTADGGLTLFLLDRSASRPAEAEAQPLAAFVSGDGAASAQAIELRPQPQPGDAAGASSRFTATLPTSLVGAARRLTVPNLRIGGERFHLAYTAHATEHAEMPTPVADAERRVLYLTAAGRYTEADIAANGRLTPTEKFPNFQPRHDLKPQTGERLCPVTRTKANPACTWVVAGETYEFCCPPCIDEFVRLAKEEPEKLLPPDEYVKR